MAGNHPGKIRPDNFINNPLALLFIEFMLAPGIRKENGRYYPAIKYYELKTCFYSLFFSLEEALGFFTLITTFSLFPSWSATNVAPSSISPFSISSAIGSSRYF